MFLTIGLLVGLILGAAAGAAIVFYYQLNQEEL